MRLPAFPRSVATYVKKLRRFLSKNVPLVLVGVGLIALMVFATYRYFHFNSLSLDTKLVDEYANQQEDTTPWASPTHIVIQDLIDTPIETQVLVHGHWTISPTVASFLAQSAKPGEDGNIVIYGHNKRSIFKNLVNVKPDQLITITTEDGAEHTYKVSATYEVDPNQIQYIEPTRTETLTLYTCSGFLDKKRFIVRASPVETP
jgi:LPXTG-site transpeptidase (sortase) family protein